LSTVGAKPWLAFRRSDTEPIADEQGQGGRRGSSGAGHRRVSQLDFGGRRVASTKMGIRPYRCKARSDDFGTVS
jgi:hypothetical protein